MQGKLVIHLESGKTIECVVSQKEFDRLAETKLEDVFQINKVDTGTIYLHKQRLEAVEFTPGGDFRPESPAESRDRVALEALEKALTEQEGLRL